MNEEGCQNRPGGSTVLAESQLGTPGGAGSGPGKGVPHKGLGIAAGGEAGAGTCGEPRGLPLPLSFQHTFSSTRTGWCSLLLQGLGFRV
jgi:hypothetical protein